MREESIPCKHCKKMFIKEKGFKYCSMNCFKNGTRVLMQAYADKYPLRIELARMKYIEKRRLKKLQEKEKENEK